MKCKLLVSLVFLILLLGCASYQFQPDQTGSCDPYVKYRGYSGPYCSPSP